MYAVYAVYACTHCSVNVQLNVIILVPSLNSIWNWYISSAWHSHLIHLKFKRFQWKAKRQKSLLFWNWIAHKHAFVNRLSLCASVCLAVRFSSVSMFSRVLRISMERTNKVIYKWYVRVSSCKNWIVSGDLTFETRIDWDFRWMKKKTCLMKTKTIPSNCIRFGLDRNWARAHFWCKHLRSVT